MKNTYGVKPLKEEGKELEGYHTDESAKKIMDREEKERQEEFKKQYSNKQPYPNATIEEVKKNATDVPSSNPAYEFNPPRAHPIRKYNKGDFGYMIDGEDIKAVYLPSMKQGLKVMFSWNPTKRRWVLLTYREGDW